MSWKLIVIAGLILLSGNLYAVKPDKALPFHGVFSGYVLPFVYVWDDPIAVAERCDNTPEGFAAWAIASFEGWGTATHMGSSYIYAEHCSYYNLDDETTGTYGEGEALMIADNGDILIGTYTNGVSLSGPPIIGFMDEVTFEDGGTGRFTYASGGGVEMGSIDINDGSFTLQMTGVIAYSKR